MMGMIFLYGGMIIAVVSVEIYIVQCFDEKVWDVGDREKALLLVGGGINGGLILEISPTYDIHPNESMLLTIVAGGLLFACMTDCRICEVYQFAWWIAGAAGGLLLYLRIAGEFKAAGAVDVQIGKRLLVLLLYALIQELFFSWFYGRADCHAFTVCAIAECALGMGMREYLLHMLFAFGGLAVVQALRGNINRGGNLKQPVAFLPYITISFWGLLFCFRLLQKGQ